MQVHCGALAETQTTSEVTGKMPLRPLERMVLVPKPNPFAKPKEMCSNVQAPLSGAVLGWKVKALSEVSQGFVIQHLLGALIHPLLSFMLVSHTAKPGQH